MKWRLGIGIAVSFLAALLDAHAVTLIHSNDVMGEIEPCGCRSNPLGGMARKYHMVQNLGGPGSLLQLDAGDLLFPMDDIPELLAPQSEVQAQYLLESMDLLHHDAVVPGEKDFALGIKVFNRLRSHSKVKFLASNLLKGNSSFLEKDLIFNKTDKKGKILRIGVFGLVGEDLQWPSELKVTPALAAARAEVKKLRKKVDVLIALTHQGYEKDQQLAKSVQGIDIIIGGHTQSFLQVPAKTLTGTLILQSSFRNQYLGSFPLSKTLDASAYQMVPLDPGLESSAGHASPMDALVDRFKAAVAAVNLKTDLEAEATASKTTDSSATRYQTFPRCAECHLKQFDFWRKTAHADAFHALVEKKQTQNLDCLRCHTVGLGEPKGFTQVARLAEVKGEPYPIEDLDRFLTKVQKAPTLKEKVQVKSEQDALPLHRAISSLTRSWTPVQCENCHSPGRDHPFSGHYTKTVEKTACLKCHREDQSPAWYASHQPNWQIIDQKRKLITCPAGDFSPED